jgi:hypothetical protein
MSKYYLDTSTFYFRTYLPAGSSSYIATPFSPLPKIPAPLLPARQIQE